MVKLDIVLTKDANAVSVQIHIDAVGVPLDGEGKGTDTVSDGAHIYAVYLFGPPGSMVDFKIDQGGKHLASGPPLVVGAGHDKAVGFGRITTL